MSRYFLNWTGGLQSLGSTMRLIPILVSALLAFSPTSSQAIVASPTPVTLTQPDGAKIVLQVRGDEFVNWFEDINGFSVVRDNGTYVYARLDVEGKLAPTPNAVGKSDPATLGLKEGLVLSSDFKAQRRAALFPDAEHPGVAKAAPRAVSGNSFQAVQPNGTVKNLVILCKFSDHDNSDIRPESDYDIVFNNNGPHPFAPSGSVKDFYKETSFGILTIDSTVLAWVTLPQTEAYYADGITGFGNYPRSAQGMVKDALDLVDPLVNFAQFDADNDGFIDAISIIHSGYGGETGGGNGNWIWSHRWALTQVPGGRWQSADLNGIGANVKVFDYHTEPALWDVQGNEIVRIGVIAHELGHFFGLPDLYDTDGVGEGVGSYCLMANSWGFDNSQLHPPLMSAWCKTELGWISPTEVSDGLNSVPAAVTSPVAYKVSQGFPAGEYLLIENRQPSGFESAMPQGGLCIWHIDEAKSGNDDEGYPGQAGWPGNNRHYKLALLQADGLFQMERGLNRGNRGDVYHGGGVARIGPSTVPSTVSYQGGVLGATGPQISSISTAGDTMTFVFGPVNAVEFTAPTYNVQENVPGFVTITVTNMLGDSGTVDYATSDGTAVAGVDYIEKIGTLKFNSGESNKVITIPIFDNAVVNADKTFQISLSNPIGAIQLGTITDSVITIADDERQVFVSSAGEFTFSSTLYKVTENETFQAPWSIPEINMPSVSSRSARGALVTVIRTNGAVGRVKVDYTTTNITATAGLDYTARSGTLVFDDYQMSTNILIPISNSFVDTNGLIERDFGIVLSNPRPFDEENPTIIIPKLGTTNTTVRIRKVNSETTNFSFERVNYRIDEFGDPASNFQPPFPQMRTNISVDVILPTVEGGSVRLHLFIGGEYGWGLFFNQLSFFPWAPLSAGSDYAEGAQFVKPNPIYTDGSPEIINLQDFEPFGYTTLTFGQNERRKRVLIPIIKDPNVEFNEDFMLELDRPSPIQNRGIGNGYASVTILYHDQPTGAADREWNSDNVARTTPPFNSTPGANNSVRSVAVQADGKTLLAGDFTSVNTITRNRIARMTVDGSLDATFDPGTGFDEGVDVILVQTNGTILVAGGFSSFNGTQRNGIARLFPNGSLDTGFAPGNGSNGRIRAMAVQQDGKIVIAGEFTTYNDEIQNGIARLNVDGSLDDTFNAGFGPDATIWALGLQKTDFNPERIIIGGDFTTINGEVRPGLARLQADGAVDLSFTAGRGANDSVYAISVQDDQKIIVGGAFTELDVFPRNGIGRLNVNGDVDTSYEPGAGFDDSVYAITLQPDGKALAGGIFREFNQTRRIGLARLKPNGTLDTTFLDTAYNQFAGVINAYNFQPPNFINSIALETNGNVMIGGSFKRLGGNPSDDMALRNAYTKYTRADIRTRYNIARLIGGVTPGPGNIEYIPTPYRTDEDAGTMSLTLRRIDGRLGTAQVTSSSTNNIGIAGLDYIGVSTNEIWTEFKYVAPISVGDVGYQYTQVSILDDQSVEGDETINLGLSRPIGRITLGGEYVPLGAALGVRNSNLTIVDNDFDHGILSFSSPTYTINENGVRATITVLRTNGSSGPISVDYFTKPGTAPQAIPGQDYSNVSNTLSFASGQTSRTFTIPIADDFIVELDKNVLITLTNATGGAKLPGGQPTSQLQANLTIIDNDFAAGRLNFSSIAYTNREDTGAAVITVTRSGGNVGIVSVDYKVSNGIETNGAVSGLDYTSSNGTLTWNNGESAAKTFVVNLIGPDQLIEGSETIRLTLTNATIAGALGGRTNATLYIEDADSYGSLSFSQPVFAADENGASANITVLRNGGIAGTVEVSYATIPGSAIPGTDYNDVSGRLILGPGQTGTNFFVPILNDTVIDGDKTLQVQLSSFTNATIGNITNAILTLIDDESFSIPAGTLDTTFDQNVKADNSIYGLALQPDGRLLIAGDFTNINDVARSRVARLRDTGVLDNTFNPGTGPNDSVRSVLLQPDGRIVIAGLFTNVNETNRNRVARLRTDGSVDDSFNPGSGANNPVYSMALQSDRKILLGGAFNTFNGVSRPGLARVNTNGTLDVSFNPGTEANGPIFAVAVQNNGKILVGGDFTTFNGVSRSYLIRLNANGSVDNSFTNIIMNAAVRAIHIQADGKIVIGGSFTVVGGVTRGYLARLNVNGTLDSSFLQGGLAGADNSVYAIAQQVDGKLLVAGDFTRFNNVTRSRLTRLINDGLNDGATDPTINFGTGANNFVNAVLVQTDRKIVFAGGFTTYNDKPRKYIARVHGGSIVGAGSLEYSSPVFNQSENGTNAVIRVRRVGGTTGPAGVNYATANGTATAGTHYQATSGLLSFPEGEVIREFTVPVFDDAVVNTDRSVQLLLSGYSGGATNGPQSSAILAIINDDSLVSFASANFTVNENAAGGNATIAVTRSGATNTVSQVQYAAAVGGTATINSDFVFTNGVLIFQPGEVSKNFQIAIIDDAIIEPIETVKLVLGSPSPAGSVHLGTPTNATLSIVDNDFGPGEISVALPNFFANEFQTNASITLVRSNGSTGVVSVRVATSNLTAIAGQDYLAANTIVSFADGELTKQFFINLINDSVLESDETFAVTLSQPQGGVTIGSLFQTTVTVLDDDASIVPAGSSLVSESILPTNNVIDPAESIRILFGLRNGGRINVANLSARLISTNGVNATNTTQNYGYMVTNGPVVSREFAFTAQGTNGTRISPTLELRDGTNFIGTAIFSYILGQAGAVFANTNVIIVNDNGPANPYPSAIHVSGVAGPITKVVVTVKGIRHTFPDDMDMLLVGPGGQRVLLMANSGGSGAFGLNNVTLSFDDAAAGYLPDDAQIVTGIYKPTSYGVTRFANAPPEPYADNLAVFNNTSANGAWSLYVIDDLPQDAGIITNGWSLSITSKDVVVPVVDLAASITASSAISVGDQVAYMIVVTNNGPALATNVTVLNSFNSGVTLHSVSGNATAQQIGSQAINLTLSPSLANGATATITFKVTPVAGGNLTNTAVVGTSQGDPNSGNNTVLAITSVAAQGPRVLAVLDAGNLVLRWPTSSGDLMLWKSADLITWVEETQPPTTEGDQFVFSVSVSAEARLFYRLGPPQ